MSLISNLLDKLNELCDGERLNPEDRATVCDAIDTIEMQSAKLTAHNLHGGWVSCEERLPNCETKVLAYYETPTGERKVDLGFYLNDTWYIRNHEEITYWMELPELPEMGGAE